MSTKVLIDKREEEKYSNLLPKEWEKQRKQLAVADYIVQNEDTQIAVERKRSGDFKNSIKGGRIFRQAQKMSENFENNYLIAIDPFKETDEKYTANSIIGAIASIEARYGVSVLIVNSEIEIFYMIEKLFSKTGQGPVSESVNYVRSHDSEDIFKNILLSFPGVGNKTARLITDNYDTIKEFANTTEDELKSIEGVGDKISKSIHEILEQNKNEVREVQYIGPK